MREVRAAGLEALRLATELLQRARRADPLVGLWEAADVQWWWRRPGPSDEAEKLFWVDDEGPVAGVLLSSWRADDWQCDPVLVPGAVGPSPEDVWQRALKLVTQHTAGRFEIPVDDEDRVYNDLAAAAGLSVDRRDSTAWLSTADRPATVEPREGFVLVDRSQRSNEPHPMRQRNGSDVARRLEQCSLYDPTLDLAFETKDGRTAGYSLYWFDPTTRVGLVEPVRVEDEFQRQGLARAMLTEGINRLLARGASRVKISYESEAAGALYRSVGFRPRSTTAWYRGSVEPDAGAGAPGR